MADVKLIKKSGQNLEVEVDGERYVTAPLLKIRTSAMEIAIRLATAGAGHERIVDAAKAFEDYMRGAAEPAEGA